MARKVEVMPSNENPHPSHNGSDAPGSDGSNFHGSPSDGSNINSSDEDSSNSDRSGSDAAEQPTPATASYPPSGSQLPAPPPNSDQSGQQHLSAQYPPAPIQPTDSRSSAGYGYPTPYGQPATQGYGQTGYGGYAAGTGNYGGGFGPNYPAAGYPAAAELPPGNYRPPAAPYGQADWSSEPGPTAPTKTGNRARPLLLVALVAALVGGGVGGGIVALVDHNTQKTASSGLKITNQTGVKPAVLDGTVGAAATKIRPSVVTINVTSSQEAATGSGVIIRDNGTILTNDHVVDISGGKIVVVLSDGRTAAARILGRDTSDDLAVIKVDGLTNLTAAMFAKSSSLNVGDTVVAVGAPLGLSDTVTSGIVSNTARPVRAGDNDQAVFDAVQTDAAINPGNSGGPLVDLSGSVVGINAAIASDQSSGGLQIPGQQAQAGNIGIGFAIPSDEASRIAGELIVNGKATHAVLGVSVQNAATTSTTPGVPLKQITAGGVGEKAGLKVGDLVTQIDDERVTTADSLIAAVRSHAPGEQVKVSYTRGGQAATVNVVLGSSDS